MPDGGAPMARRGIRGVILAAARRCGDTPFSVDDIHARVGWLTRAQVKHQLVGLVRVAEIHRVGVFAERRRGTPRTAYVARPPHVPLPDVVAPNGSRRAPDARAADERWSARVVAGARFNDPITADERTQLRRLSGWQSD